MSRGRIEVDILSRAGSVARGYGSRELVAEVTGKTPVYASLSRGWGFQTWRLGNLLAVAEHRGYDVEVLGPRIVIEPQVRHDLLDKSGRTAGFVEDDDVVDAELVKLW